MATMTARAMAGIVSKAVGRVVNAKQVRAAARDILPAYDDDGYTAHAYDARQQATLLAHFKTRAARGRTAVPVKVRAAGRAAKASSIKSTTPSKATAPKVAAVAPVVPKV